jgi:hypothetical protein
VKEITLNSEIQEKLESSSLLTEHLNFTSAFSSGSWFKALPMARMPVCAPESAGLLSTCELPGALITALDAWER